MSGQDRKGSDEAMLQLVALYRANHLLRLWLDLRDLGGKAFRTSTPPTMKATVPPRKVSGVWGCRNPFK
ncbi:Hypothetical protein PHPALM_36256 [Phytophthora palmivora]|uniref:Uncharacterized protein n=1 Tax=Phytophthora palmivora TaxID=4796 RepID=A0A2P4X0E0_9STRA|nr:Hypothetical protein PHPALM_36256 [Phytophthora palmivora]